MVRGSERANREDRDLVAIARGTTEGLSPDTGPVVPTVASRGQGLERLVQVGLREAQSRGVGVSQARYGTGVVHGPPAPS